MCQSEQEKSKVENDNGGKDKYLIKCMYNKVPLESKLVFSKKIHKTFQLFHMVNSIYDSYKLHNF